jgi:hypothetical protein
MTDHSSGGGGGGARRRQRTVSMQEGKRGSTPQHARRATGAGIH